MFSTHKTFVFIPLPFFFIAKFYLLTKWHKLVFFRSYLLTKCHNMKGLVLLLFFYFIFCRSYSSNMGYHLGTCSIVWCWIYSLCFSSTFFNFFSLWHNMSCPKTHFKVMTVISHFNPKGSKRKQYKHSSWNWKFSITKLLF